MATQSNLRQDLKNKAKLNKRQHRLVWLKTWLETNVVEITTSAVEDGQSEAQRENLLVKVDPLIPRDLTFMVRTVEGVVGSGQQLHRLQAQGAGVGASLQNEAPTAQGKTIAVETRPSVPGPRL